MNIEQMKLMILDVFKQSQSIDARKTPTFYFTKKLYTNLLSIGNVYTKEIVENIVVDLSGLGTDYEVHQEYLDELASVVASSLNQIWITGQEISEGYAIKLMRGVSIKIAA